MPPQRWTVVVVLLRLLACFPVGLAHGHGVNLNSLIRDLLGGGAGRNFLHELLHNEKPKMSLGTESEVEVLPDGTKRQTFLSFPLKMKPGEIVQNYMAIPWPSGHIAVKTFNADIVKDSADGEPPPATLCCGGPNTASREELYLHHWTVNKWQLPARLYQHMVNSKGISFSEEGLTMLETVLADAGGNSGADGPCVPGLLHFFFGSGNEVRGLPSSNGGVGEALYDFPDPYAVVFDSDLMKRTNQFMILNNHLLDIRNVTDRRGCTECACNVTGVQPDDPRYLGGLACCHSTASDGGRCPVTPGTELKEQSYYVRYTITWREFDAASVKPLEATTFDISDDAGEWSGPLPWWIPMSGSYHEDHEALKHDPALQKANRDRHSGIHQYGRMCHVEYYVPACRVAEDCIHSVHNSWRIPYTSDIVFVRHHFHGGGVNMTLSTDSSELCISMPHYRRGWITDISTCTFGKAGGSPPVRIHKGGRLISRAAYQQDHRPHYGVMGFTIIWSHRVEESGTASQFLAPQLV